MADVQHLICDQSTICIVFIEKIRMSDEYVEIGLKSAPAKLQTLFPNDPRADIDIIYGEKTYKLQKAHLRLESHYFRKNLSIERSILEIEGNFNEQFFENLLSCFYGFKHQIMRYDVMSYFPIARFFGIDIIAEQLRRDMIRNSSHYNIFDLFQLSYKFNEQKIFQNCLDQLENHKFSQILEEREAFLQTPIQIFKLVLTTHSRSPNRILNFYKIQSLIEKFGEINNLPFEQVRHLKFQLIDKSKLTSQEYRDIFIKNNNDVRNNFSLGVRTLSLKNINSEEQASSPVKVPSKYSLSVNYQQYHRSLTLEMQHTWHKKITEELIKEKRKIGNDIKDLAKSSEVQKKQSEHVQRQFDSVRKEINSYDDEEKQMTKKFRNIDNLLSDIQKDFQEQNRKLEAIRKNAGEMLDKYDKKGKASYAGESKKSFAKKTEEPPMIEPQKTGVDLIFAKKPVPETPRRTNVKSSVTNANQYKKMKSTPHSKEEPKTINKDELFSKYQEQIQFDKLPCSISTQSQITSLSQIIGADRFAKKDLRLVFRYSNTTPKYGDFQDMHYLGDLLFLIRTKAGKLIGGYAHNKIDRSLSEIPDDRAYIFSVTSNRKFMIKKQEDNDAISIEPGYILCFRTDLMISQKWDEEENFCSWPESYQSCSKIEERGSRWLVGGDSQFAITELQCYQIEESGMEMMII